MDVLSRSMKLESVVRGLKMVALKRSLMEQRRAEMVVMQSGEAPGPRPISLS